MKGEGRSIDSAVTIRGLVKRYGEKLAVAGIDLDIQKGEVFALLGPNGAGKTTTLECLEGIRRPDAGSLRVCGLDPRRDSRLLMMRTGIQLQTQGLPGTMTVKEAVEFFAHYRGLEPSFRHVERLGLGPEMKTRYGDLSVGRQRRLVLALALGHEPELVFLDEPTAGLDVESRNELHAMIFESRKEGKTILLATHDMAEVEKLADRAAVMVAGRIAAVGSPTELTAGGAGKTRITASTTMGALVRELPEFDKCDRLPVDGAYARYITDDVASSLRSILSWMDSRGDTLIDLRVERPTLEERFLEITGRKS